MKQQIKSETEFLKSIKSEEKDLKKRHADLLNEIQNIRRAIIIKSKEVNKHKLNIKSNDIKLKGVVNHMTKVSEKIVGLESKTIELSRNEDEQKDSKI